MTDFAALLILFNVMMTVCYIGGKHAGADCDEFRPQDDALWNMYSLLHVAHCCSNSCVLSLACTLPTIGGFMSIECSQTRCLLMSKFDFSSSSLMLELSANLTSTWIWKQAYHVSHNQANHVGYHQPIIWVTPRTLATSVQAAVTLVSTVKLRFLEL